MNQIYIKGITLSTSTKINTLLFADDQVNVADSENNLQRRVFHITKHSPKKIEIEISQVKSETIGYIGNFQSSVK
jgi:hypothetical protein